MHLREYYPDCLCSVAAVKVDFTETPLYRSFKFLLQATVLHEERPRHAADDGRHAAIAGGCGVWLVELQGAGCQVDLCAQTRHRVNVEVVLLTLQI